MRKLFFLLLMLFTTGSAMAQVVQKGKTLLYNGADAKTPLAGVSISAYGATSTMSDEKGNFALTFRVMHEGDKVNVRRLEKAGYEVFNTDALEQWYITRSNNAFQIVMCETATLSKLKDKYRQAATQACTNQLAKDEAREEEQRKKGVITEEEYQRRIEKLEMEHEKQLDKIDTYVDRFARIDLSTISKEEQQIILLIEQGKFDEAIAAYDKLQLVDKYRTERTSIHALDEAKKKIEEAQAKHAASAANICEAVKRQVNLLRMAGGQENINKAHDILQNLYQADTTQVKPALIFAQFLFDQDEYNEEYRILDKMLPFCQNWLDSVKVLNMKANVDVACNLQSESQMILEQSKNICNQHIHEDEGSSLSVLQILFEIHTNQGANFSILRQDSLAGLQYVKAMDIAERILAIDTTQIKNLALANFLQGNLLFKLMRYEEARPYLEKSIQLCDSTSKDPNVLERIARWKGILAIVVSRLGEKGRALQLTHESVQATEKLYESNPNAYRYNLGTSKLQAAVFAKSMGDMEKYEKYMNESISIFEQLAQKYPLAYTPVLKKLIELRDNKQ